MTHRPVDCDLIHDPLDDVTAVHQLTAQQFELVEILGWGPCRHGHVRLTERQWRTLTDLADWSLRRTAPIPAPRTPADSTCAT